MSSSLRTSKSFYDWVKDTDQFGEQIIFTINSNSSYRSFFGVLFSFILFCVGIAMFIFMGQSFFFKVNPGVTGSIAKSLYPPLIDTQDNNKMFVAFRYRDVSLLDYPGDGTIFSITVQMTTINKFVKAFSRPAILCKESAGLDQDYLRENGLLAPNIYCVPLNSETFGGSVMDQNYTSFNVGMNFCSSSFSFCDRTKILSLLDVAQVSTYVDFFYPEVFFDPNNYETPIVVKHSKISDAYLGRSAIFREVYFKQTFLYDDHGWILEENNLSQYVSVGEQMNRVNYKSDLADNTIGRYFFYMGPTTETFKRKYQKLQDVVAIVGGFLKICQTLLKLCLTNFVKYLKNIEIMNGIINWTDEDDSQLPKNMNDRSSLDSKVKKAIRLVSNSIEKKKTSINDETGVENKDLSRSYTHNHLGGSNKNNQSYLLGICEQTNLRLKDPDTNTNKENKVYSKVEKSTHKKTEKNLTEVDIYKLKNEIFTTSPKYQKKYLFSLSFPELIKKMFCRRFLNSSQLINVRIYDYAERYLKERLDVFGYLDLINEFNKLKSILFNSQQINCFNHIENPTIPVNSKNLNPENIDNLKYLLPSKSEIVNENDVKTISDYFAKTIYDRDLSFADRVLLMSMSEEILREILHKLIEVKEKMRMNKNIVIDSVENNNEEVLNFGCHS